jgi:cytochrome c oxidase subunit 2
MLGALLLFIVSPFISGWWLPKDISTYGGGIDRLFYIILGTTAFFFILTEAILVYAMLRYAGRPERRSSYVHGNHTLEMVWTLVPGVLLFLLAVVQINVWAEVKFQKNMPAPDAKTQQIEVVARQWEWRVRYPSEDRMKTWQKDPTRAKDFEPNPHQDDVHSVNEIHVWKGGKEPPEQHRVLVHLKTRDVIHSFFLPNLRLKQDALPGKTIPVWFAVTESNTKPIEDSKTHEKRWVEVGCDAATGEVTDPSKIWELACAEFCGTRHSLMRGKLYVHENEADFLDWLRHAEAAQNRH